MSEFSYLVAYDVTDDARRARLAQTLLDLGASRLQRSVYWLTTDAAGLIRMRSIARSTIDEYYDRVHWYRTCGNCPGVVGHTRAATLPPTTDGGLWII